MRLLTEVMRPVADGRRVGGCKIETASLGFLELEERGPRAQKPKDPTRAQAEPNPSPGNGQSLV